MEEQIPPPPRLWWAEDGSAAPQPPASKADLEALLQWKKDHLVVGGGNGRKQNAKLTASAATVKTSKRKRRVRPE